MNGEADKFAAIAMATLGAGLATHTAWKVRMGIFETRTGRKIEKKKSPREFKIEAIMRFSIALLILASTVVVCLAPRRWKKSG